LFHLGKTRAFNVHEDAFTMPTTGLGQQRSLGTNGESNVTAAAKLRIRNTSHAVFISAFPLGHSAGHGNRRGHLVGHIVDWFVVDMLLLLLLFVVKNRTMKRALDVVLVGIWSFLLLFVLGAALVLLALPARWQAAMSTQDVFESSMMVLCWLSSSRFVSFMERPQWIPLVVQAVLLPFYYWFAPAPSKRLLLHHLATTAAATWIVVLLFIPLYVVLKPYIRIKWGRKKALSSKRQEALKALMTDRTVEVK
jgi:hypothetical protein